MRETNSSLFLFLSFSLHVCTVSVQAAQTTVVVFATIVSAAVVLVTLNTALISASEALFV